MAKKAVTKEEMPLLAALKFIALAQHETGAPNQVNCRLLDNSITAYDGVLACGAYLPETVPAICPNTMQLIKAMEKASDVSALSFETNSIIVKTNKFRAIVPCVPGTDLMFIYPDQPLYELTNNFRSAAMTAAIWTKENAQTVVAASIMLRPGSCVGTNGRALIEVWHGVDMPSGLIVPKTFIDALGKVKKNITRFGFSDTSLTIWFDDNSWLKTQLYSEQWPNIDLFLAYTETAKPELVTKEFWEAIKTISVFSEDGRIFMNEGFVCSHKSTAKGAEYKLKGLPSDQSYDFKLLLAISELATSFDWEGNDRVTCFFGDKLRGVLAKSSY